MMKKFFLGLIIFVLFLAALATMLPMLVPAETYKGRIEAAASKAMGRPVSIGNELSLKVFPQLAFSVSDLKIANAEGFDGDYLAEISRAEIGVAALPLLNKRVEIAKFVLHDLTLNLQRSKQGHVNWLLGTPADTESTATASNTGPALPSDLSLGDVRIVNGTASYHDAMTKQRYVTQDLNVSARLPSLAKPFELKGSLNFQGSPSTANIVMTTPRDFLRGENANLKMDLALGDATVGTDLTISDKDGLAYNGPLVINAPDLPSLAGLFNIALRDAPGFDVLKMSANTNGTADFVKLDISDLTFDKILANGAITLNWTGPRPKASGKLASPLLDLRPYMPPPANDAEGFPAWSEDKIDFTSLQNLDASLVIDAEKTLLNQLTIGAARMEITIVNGRLTADLPTMEMYGGKGSGNLVVNSRNKTPSLAGNFAINNISAQPFAIDMLHTDRLIGAGTLNMNFTASGASQAAIMRSLNGNGGFDLADGVVKGLNLAKMVRSAAQLAEGVTPATLSQALSTARGPNETTDFSKFLSNFTMKNGIVNVPAVTMSSPYFSMGGNGTVNLPNQGLALHLSPKASTSLDGSGGRFVTIPILVSGSFSNPKIGLDVEAIAKDRVSSGLKKLFEKKKPEDEEGADAREADQEQKEESPADQLIKGIFGGGSASAAPSGAGPASAGDTPGTAPENEPDDVGQAVDLLFGVINDAQKNESQPDQP